MEKITILSTGTWGTALAKTLCEAGHEITAWSPFESEINELKRTHMHRNLTGVLLPSEIRFTTSMEEAVDGASHIIVASPSTFVRGTASLLKEYIKEGQTVSTVAKGIENDTLFTMSEVIEDVLGNGDNVIALSGPTHAEEVAVGIPTCIVSAAVSEETAKNVQRLFVGTCIRPYTNTDIKGVELCGALKNIVALACGISTGIGYGDNTKAALITRGMSEITRLGMAMGCSPHTFYGLAGVGDLIVTATSEHSRNNRCGRFIGEGMPVKAAIERVGMVVEGINALSGAMKLKEKYGVEMPITETVNNVINNGVSPRDAVDGLLSRSIKSEILFTSDCAMNKTGV